MVIVSFVLGALVSITIQACGGDENKFEQDCGSGNSTSSANCECSWESQNMAYYEICDENGQISNRWDYVYDNKGRMVEAKSVQYQKGYPSGKRYLSFVNHSVYTYSDSGDCRYGRTVSTLYNEDGSVMREDQSSEKMILYIDCHMHSISAHYISVHQKFINKQQPC